MYETEQNNLANEYYLTTNPESKEKILNKRINKILNMKVKHIKGENG